MTLTLVKDGRISWDGVQLLGGIFILAGSTLISLSKVMLKEKNKLSMPKGHGLKSTL